MSVEARPKGSRIDRYELRDRVGEGGMGNVYRAVDTKIGRTVAVKVLVPPDGRPLTDQLRERFLREVLAISRIDHPNVVKVHDYGFGADGTPYLVMEYLEGRDLSKLLRESKEPLPIDQVADIMLEVCAALRACHEVSVVHRDLKPANVFLATTESGSGWQVKIVDFGVSKAPVAGDLTEHGQIVGTWQYLSPEQVNGKAGPASDQYALGVLLYACLTRRLPYGGLKHVALLKAIDKGEFRKPRVHRSEIPEALEAIILRAMHLSPTERFDSVYALGQSLWEFASPLGRETWKKFYIHSPVPAPAPREISAGIPIAIVQSLAERRIPDEGSHPEAPDAEGQTEIAHYQSTTAASRAGEGALGLPLSQRHLVLPSRHPTLSDNITTTPVSGYPVVSAAAQKRGGEATGLLVDEVFREDLNGVASGDARGEESRTPSSSDGNTKNPKRRQLLGTAAALLTVVVAGSVAWGLHRPEKHLIRPARLPLPVEQTGSVSQRSVVPAPPAAEATPTGPSTLPSAPGPTAEAQWRASGSVLGAPTLPGTLSGVSAPPAASPRPQAPAMPLAAGSAAASTDGVTGTEEQPKTASPKKKRRVRVHQEVEMTPDGIPLLR